ncbi:MAG: biliverdin-producing heme oxygenase [Phycisphaeraceae bacterium]|nr:biliverdin-producing heme oxygenase [Phycisphaeraceae bacterium]MCW5762199.1 biliverdin-producing heme oxygenase [Phycisphaeraceae bacterium]
MALPQMLREDTRELHTYAEKRPLQVEFVTGRTTRTRLASYLSQLAHIHKALEDAIGTHANHEAIAPLAQHTAQHSGRLSNDVAVLDPDGSRAPMPGTQALIATLHQNAQRDPATAAGSLYVLEGSMNGNRFIARALSKALQLSPALPGLSYFDPYGEGQPAKWAAFREALDAVPQPHWASVVAGAEFMFRAIADVSDEVHASLADTPAAV